MSHQVQPALSVLVPIYNAGSFLREAMESVLAQTFEDLEVIAVDDGSTDDSLDILQEFSSTDQRVTIITRPNTGIVGALNDGLASAKGEFIARMDGDDIADSLRFERQVAYLHEHPDVICVGCRCLVVDEDDDPFNTWGRDQQHADIETKLLQGIASALVHSSVMMRRTAILDVGGYRNDVGASEDLDLYLRLSERGRLANLPEVLMTVRRHDSSTSANRSEAERHWSRRKILNDALQRRGSDHQPASTNSLQGPLGITDVYHLRAMQALKNGFRATARKYGRRSLRSAPWAMKTWKLLVKTYLTGAAHARKPGHDTLDGSATSTNASWTS